MNERSLQAFIESVGIALLLTGGSIWFALHMGWMAALGYA